MAVEVDGDRSSVAEQQSKSARAIARAAMLSFSVEFAAVVENLGPFRHLSVLSKAFLLVFSLHATPGPLLRRSITPRLAPLPIILFVPHLASSRHHLASRCC